MVTVHLFHYTKRGISELKINEFPLHGIFLNELFMIVSMDIVIIFGSDDGYLSALLISIGVKSRRF